MANGWSVWSMWHKLCWIFAIVASFCYLMTYMIWLILCHIDIVANIPLHSETFTGMKVVPMLGPAAWMVFISFITMLVSAILYRIHFWRMKTISVKYLYEESESSSEIIKSAQIDFLLHPDSD